MVQPARTDTIKVRTYMISASVSISTRQVWARALTDSAPRRATQQLDQELGRL